MARIANGMEPLPIPFEQAIAVMARVPQDLWVVLGSGFTLGIAYLWCLLFGVENRWRVFWSCCLAVFIVRFVFEGHLPLNGFVDYGVSHYIVHKASFMIRIVLTGGLAWQAARLGSRLREPI